VGNNAAAIIIGHRLERVAVFDQYFASGLS
jgi:hypothetical protein